MHVTSVPSVSHRPHREVPIYLHTTCVACGADQGVAVRYRDSVLCLDCYRDAKREACARGRHLKGLGGARA